jgi:hypothetical protein
MSGNIARCFHSRLPIPIFCETSRCLIFGALVCASVAIVLPAPVRGQSLSLEPFSLPKTTVFLADPQLGIAGAYQVGDATLYFEVRTPDESTEMSARLLDARGGTIAISGHSMDAEWSPKTPIDYATAAPSLGLAGGLPVALAAAFDKTVFSKEIALVSSLATGVINSSAGSNALRVDATEADQTSVPESDREAGITGYEARAAAELNSSRDADGNLSIAFHEIRIMTVVNYFADGENEDNPAGVMGRTEVSARILSSQAKTVIQQFGGDEAPEGWDLDETASATPVDPIRAGIETGTAIRAAALGTRYAHATSEEAAAIGNLAAQLRDQGMFPNPDLAADSSSSESAPESDTCGACYRTDIQVWNKGLAGVAQHSGTIVLHYNDNNPSRYPVLENTTLFCNHGTCPGHKPMNHAATCDGNWLTSYRNPPHHKITAPPPSPPSGYHSCYKTPYHLNGGFPFPWDHGHNCNDDTWTQIHAVLGKPYAISNGARCDDHALDPRAPGCND